MLNPPERKHRNRFTGTGIGGAPAGSGGCACHWPLHGFTLIELLVVIAILALLVSILVPSLRSATELAKEVMCLSNLRGMYLGLAVYSHESDGDLPPGWADRETAKNTHWTKILADSMGEELGPSNSYEPGETYGLFLCPVAERITRDRGHPIKWGSTYCYINWFTIADCRHLMGWKLELRRQTHRCDIEGERVRERNMIGRSGGRVLDEGDASRTPLLQGVSPGPMHQTGTGGSWAYTWRVTPNVVQLNYEHHRGGAHYLFFDGHAGWIEYRGYTQGMGDGF